MIIDQRSVCRKAARVGNILKLQFMKTNLNELPNSLDILEMMEVKGGTDSDDITCKGTAIYVECTEKGSGFINPTEND